MTNRKMPQELWRNLKFTHLSIEDRHKYQAIFKRAERTASKELFDSVIAKHETLENCAKELSKYATKHNKIT